jgi:hypothetical protein
MFWAVSCIETALKMKFAETHPDPIRVTRMTAEGVEESCQIPIAELQDYRRQKWRLPEMKAFDYSLQALLVWAFRERLLPEDIPIPVPEILASFEHRFMLRTFPARAVKDGLLDTEPETYEGILNCWNGLDEAKKNHYRPKASTILVEELPRFRNRMAHPEHFNLIVFRRAPILACGQLHPMLETRLKTPYLTLNATASVVVGGSCYVSRLQGPSIVSVPHFLKLRWAGKGSLTLSGLLGKCPKRRGCQGGRRRSHRACAARSVLDCLVSEGHLQSA